MLNKEKIIYYIGSLLTVLLVVVNVIYLVYYYPHEIMTIIKAIIVILLAVIGFIFDFIRDSYNSIDDGFNKIRFTNISLIIIIYLLSDIRKTIKLNS
jgi:O-antigen/teichoic acid export membrane protein